MNGALARFCAVVRVWGSAITARGSLRTSRPRRMSSSGASGDARTVSWRSARRKWNSRLTLRRAQEGSEERMKPFVVDLREPAAVDPSLTGGKAAALARAANRGLATLARRRPDDGVLGRRRRRRRRRLRHPAVREAFDRAGGEQQRPRRRAARRSSRTPPRRRWPASSIRSSGSAASTRSSPR